MSKTNISGAVRCLYKKILVQRAKIRRVVEYKGIYWVEFYQKGPYGNYKGRLLMPDEYRNDTNKCNSIVVGLNRKIGHPVLEESYPYVF